MPIRSLPRHAENANCGMSKARRYIDFAGGIAVLNTGHRHPKVMAAVAEQLSHFTHTCFQVTPYETYIALAERLNAMAPIEGPAKTIFFTTGAEALENAIKLARAATGRSGVITFAGGYHGRTMLTMAMTGKVLPYKKRFAPLPAEVYHVPFPHAPFGVTVQDSLRALDMLFRADIEPSHVRRHRAGAGAGRRRLHPGARRNCCRACARSATGMASCWSPTRCRPASPVPARCSASSIPA